MEMKKGSPEPETHIETMGQEPVNISEPNTSKTLPAAPATQEVVESQPLASGQVEAFRPTTPGHSPGVGHSFIQD